MNRVTIRRFDIVRTATVVAVLYAVIVIVFMLVFFVPFALFAGVAGSRGGNAGVVGAALGAGIVGTIIIGLVAAVFYGVIGWIMTAIMCALYNFVAGRIGGIRVEVDVEGPYPGGPGYPYPPYAIPPGYQPGYGTQGTPYPAPGTDPQVPPAPWPPQR